MIDLRTQLRPAIVALVVLTVITGIIYPLVVTGIAQGEPRVNVLELNLALDELR